MSVTLSASESPEKPLSEHLVLRDGEASERMTCTVCAFVKSGRVVVSVGSGGLSTMLHLDRYSAESLARLLSSAAFALDASEGSGG